MAEKGDLYYNFSQLFSANAPFVEHMYSRYAENPNSVSEEWRDFFCEFGTCIDAPVSSWVINSKSVLDVPRETYSAPSKSFNVEVDAIRIVRESGHLSSSLDPLKLEKKNEFFKDDVLVDALNKVSSNIGEFYCKDVGYEFTYGCSREEKEWLYNRVENFDDSFLSKDIRNTILDNLISVESFEQFLHSKFPGAKRFSVEGADNMITVANSIVEFFASSGVEEVIFGMPHRGRLSFIFNVLKKAPKIILSEFLGNFENVEKLGISGDVKYHLGNSNDVKVQSQKKIRLSLLSNPSHLEAIDPVVIGNVRGKQDLQKDHERKKVVGVLFHGDASFSGQGVVMESLTMSELSGYSVGGVIHVVVNNQVGFTANSSDARSGRYSTNVARLIGAPIFHVNGNSVEDLIKASKIAVEYRNKFKKDVVVEIVCYRLYGHNEMDEPRFTQPEMYKAISQLKTPAEIYFENLSHLGIVDKDYFSKIKEIKKSEFEKEFALAQEYKSENVDWFDGIWEGFVSSVDSKANEKESFVSESKLIKIGTRISSLPSDLNAHKIVLKVFEKRLNSLKEGNNIDWATAESLAFGSLVEEGIGVRLSGQDSKRGTFSQRHSVIWDQETYKEYIPLNNISDKQARFEVINSMLSEYAVMGFEYGYSQSDPNKLVLWEAQFGDFANGAQVIIDQFISAAETKWMRCSGLVLLLPHGYEGQGPEHSSARLERYLQLCAQNNMQVINCSTPANYFHALRRQIYRNYRNPLIVMTPKSLLRNPRAVSNIEDFTKNGFIPVFSDIFSKGKANKLVICSGKIYYDLAGSLEKESKSSVSVLRLEQYYPFPEKELLKEMKKYTSVERVIWMQEEPENMGAWNFVRDKISKILRDSGIKKELEYSGRPASASTASGHYAIHEKEQKKIIDYVLK